MTKIIRIEPPANQGKKHLLVQDIDPVALMQAWESSTQGRKLADCKVYAEAELKDLDRPKNEILYPLWVGRDQNDQLMFTQGRPLRLAAFCRAAENGEAVELPRTITVGADSESTASLLRGLALKR